MGNNDKIFDGLLVLEYLTGNKKAFTLLVNRYNNKLCKHAHCFTCDMDASKDIVQDSWKTIMNKMGSLNNPNNFGSWAMRIVTRKSLDFVNKEKKQRIRQESYKREIISDSNDTINNKETVINKLVAGIQLLPKNHQAVLQLFYLQDYSLKEMSQILEISVGTVKSRLFHAREKLKSILKN